MPAGDLVQRGFQTNCSTVDGIVGELRANYRVFKCGVPAELNHPGRVSNLKG